MDSNNKPAIFICENDRHSKPTDFFYIALNILFHSCIWGDNTPILSTKPVKPQKPTTSEWFMYTQIQQPEWQVDISFVGGTFFIL